MEFLKFNLFGQFIECNKTIPATLGMEGHHCFEEIDVGVVVGVVDAVVVDVVVVGVDVAAAAVKFFETTTGQKLCCC